MKKALKNSTGKEAPHLTAPPRLEGKVKNATMNPIRKKNKNQKER